MRFDSKYSVPYFLKNREWYSVDKANKKCKYSLTPKAPLAAQISYKNYLKSLENNPYENAQTDENGVSWIESD
jgi:hypothetical protein